MWCTEVSHLVTVGTFSCPCPLACLPLAVEVQRGPGWETPVHISFFLSFLKNLMPLGRRLLNGFLGQSLSCGFLQHLDAPGGVRGRRLLWVLHLAGASVLPSGPLPLPTASGDKDRACAR